jgi:hypothetical protein
MRKRSIIPILILASIAFNIGFALFTSHGERGIQWPFIDLGPAVIQDSYLARAPGLESPYGVIGDVPGGYSLYSGNPLQTGSSENLTGFLNIQDVWIVNYPNYNINTLLTAFLFSVIPILIIVILGRRSYGSTKTQ